MQKKSLYRFLALLILICIFPFATLAEERKTATATIDGIPSELAPLGVASGVLYETECNDTRADANNIRRQQTNVYGWIGGKSAEGAADTYDWYRLNVDQRCHMDFVGLSGAEETKTTGFRLYNGEGKFLKKASYRGPMYAEDKADDAFIMTYSLEPGTYYIRVSDSQENTETEYAFLYILCPQAEAPELEGDNRVSNGKPVIRWKAVEGAVHYRVYRAPSENDAYQFLESTKKTSFTDTTAEPGKTYCYTVKAVADGETMKDSKSSDAVKVTCKCARPEIRLTHRSTTGKNIVKWEKVPGAKEYEVYCATSKSGNYKCIGTTDKLYLVHSTGASEKLYYYKVRAISSGTADGNSACSRVESQKTK